VRDKRNVRLVRIRNTLKLDEIHVSPALLAEVEGTQDMSLVGEPQAVRFDERGNILPY
jgi:hypothetical protein